MFLGDVTIDLNQSPWIDPGSSGWVDPCDPMLGVQTAACAAAGAVQADITKSIVSPIEQAAALRDLSQIGNAPVMNPILWIAGGLIFVLLVAR